METAFPPQLLTTYRVAATLKMIGTLTAMLTSQLLVADWALDRWWMALLTTTLLLVLLLPWEGLVTSVTPKRAQRLLQVALFVGILAPFLDLIQSLWVPFQPLQNNPLFEQMGWSQNQVYSVHALGILFVMVPVVLASWQYGRTGLFSSLGFAGMLYVLTPLFLPPNSFPWLLYWVRGFVVMGMTLILAVITHILVSAQREKQQALESANRQLAQQAEMAEQLATSRERNRLARELHDTLAHALSGTAVQLQAVGTLLPLDQDTAQQELKVAQQQIRQGLEESRRAIAALRSTPLEELGLKEALRQRVETLAERSGATPQIELDDIPPLPSAAEQALYRIVDEALLNSEKYAQARTLSLQLRWQEEQLRLRLEDDGVGFDTELALAVQKNGHYGLLGMQERAAAIGATITLDSQPEQGTCIELSYDPYQQAEAAL